ALTLASEPVAELPAGVLAQAQERALERRPELEAAAAELRRARTSLRLEGAAMWRLSAVGQTQPGALQLGPQLDLPIFDQNQGGRARARAELAAAGWRERALRERIAGEVREAQARFEQALRSHERYRDEIIVGRTRALEAAARANLLGDVDYAVVLLAQRDLDVARLRQAELAAEARRAHAELERALGDRLTGATEVSP
ncbi:MAG: TolC family protein, partial [Myxococcales bacterium]|nr:TolC family protein [Myxococcales bacterium]